MMLNKKHFNSSRHNSDNSGAIICFDFLRRPYADKLVAQLYGCVSSTPPTTDWRQCRVPGYDGCQIRGVKKKHATRGPISLGGGGH